MIHKFNKSITCTKSLDCSNLILAKLEKKFNIKFHKNKETDATPEASLSILHIQNDHIITIESNLTTKELQDTI